MRGGDRAPTAFGVTAALICLTACSASQGSTDEPWSMGPFAPLMDSYIDEARAGGATQAQLDALEVARDAGRIDIDVMRGAIASTADCLESAGFSVTVGDATRASGYVVPNFDAAYPADLSTAQGDEIVDRCERKHSRWISSAFQLQPEARDKLGAFVTSKEAPLRECLETSGFATESDATGWELAMQALQVLQDTQGPDSVDCLSQVGIDGL